MTEIEKFKHFLDGKWYLECTLLSPLSRGFLYGESVYSTLKTVQNSPLFLEDHLQRLQKGALFLYPHLELDHIEKKVQELKEGIFFLLSQNKTKRDFSLRLSFFLDNEGREIIFQSSLLHSLISLFPYQEEKPKEQYVLWHSSLTKRINNEWPAYVKCGNYVEWGLELRKAKEEGCDEVLFFTDKKTLADSVVSSIFLVQNNAILTPKLNSCVLDGVTRKHFIRAMQREGLKVQECDLNLEDVLDSQGVFLTGSLKGIRSVSGIISGKKEYKKKIDSSFLKEISTSYTNYINQYVKGLL
ncbi:MAG: aminotransferase class IV [Bacteriovoracaceae bacterium]|nr:aminotransferase class IV [Bacteriovoracaceae bacterium]